MLTVHENQDWERKCYSCGHFTGQWESMTPWRVCRNPGKLVPLCLYCAERERNLRADKEG